MVLLPGQALLLATVAGASAESTDLFFTLETVGTCPDLAALLVGDTGRVRSDDDLVFYNNRASSDGAVVYEGGPNLSESVRIRCDRLDSDVARVVLGCAGGALDAPGAPLLRLTISNAAGELMSFAEFTAEASHRAMILIEVYVRSGQWRCKLLAQGYAAGLAGLVTDFGVSVEQEPPLPAAEPMATPAQTPFPSYDHSEPPASALPAPVWELPIEPVHSMVAVDPLEAAQLPTARPSPPLGGGQPDPRDPLPAVLPAVAAQRPRGLFTSRRRLQLEAQNAELTAFISRSGTLDNASIAAERDRLTHEVAALGLELQRRRADLSDLDNRLQQLRAHILEAEGEAELQEVGVYRYRHRLEDAVAYRSQLERIRDSIRAAAKPDVAVSGSANWTVNDSLARGRTMVREVSKLMLRAYNSEADHAVRTMRPYKLDTALARLDTTRSTITRLGKTMNIHISDRYHALRRSELELTADYLSKVEEEKDRQRELRERQREDRKVEEEIARKQAQLEKERQRYATALAQLQANGDLAGAAQVRSQLSSVTAALAGLAHRRDNLRLGHVYVISNVGAFGHRMVKIGMTRRLEPNDRIRELGDASVPFKFDTHALILSEDAVELETWLHRRFRDRAVNLVNTRREFFYVTPAEVRDALAERGEQFLLQFNETADAAEWHQSNGPDRAVLPSF